MKIIRLDASAIAQSSCMLKLKRIIVDGYRSKVNANDIEFGSAFHKFVSTYKEFRLGSAKKSQEESYALGYQAAMVYWKTHDMYIKPDKKYLDARYLATTCLEYYDTYLADEQAENICTLIVDGKPLVESRFSWPCYADDEITILLCGTIDDIAKHRSGAYIIRDYKTTAVWKALEYLAAFRLSPQLRFYYLTLKKHAEAFPESIFGEMFRAPNRVGCMIDGIFLKPPSSNTPTEFKRSEVFFFTEAEIQEFDDGVDELVKKIVDLFYNGEFQDPIREGIINGACQTKFGECQFSPACGAPDEIARDHVLRNNFTKVDYDPSTFGT